MRTRRLATLLMSALVLIATVSSPACALCPTWTGTPLLSDVNEGTDLVITCATTWDPDGAGPLPERLVIAGAFSHVQGIAAPGLAQFDPTTGQWSALPPPPDSISVMQSMIDDNGLLVVAGLHYSGIHQSRAIVAGWDGENWQELGPGFTDVSGLDPGVRGLQVYDGQLVAGGYFTLVRGGPVTSLARWDGAQWQSMGFENSGYMNTNDGSTEYVTSMAQWNGSLVIGGSFIDPVTSTPTCVVAWDGTSWSGFLSPTMAGVHALQPFNGRLYATTSTPATRDESIASWDGSQWQVNAPIPNYYRSHLAVYQGSLYICGDQYM